MATLFYASGPDEGRWVPIQRKTIVVGRDEGLLVQVLGEGVSRKHLQIRYDPATDAYIAVDLKSKNGVYIDGQRITEEVPLRDEQLIRIGDALLFFTRAEFHDDNNALRFYRQRGQRALPTVAMQVPRDPAK